MKIRSLNPDPARLSSYSLRTSIDDAPTRRSTYGRWRNTALDPDPDRVSDGDWPDESALRPFSAYPRNHPISVIIMSTNNHKPRSAELSEYRLSWAFDDEESPTEITIFDPQDETTTRWITMEKDYVRDLDSVV